MPRRKTLPANSRRCSAMARCRPCSLMRPKPALLHVRAARPATRRPLASSRRYRRPKLTFWHLFLRVMWRRSCVPAHRLVLLRAPALHRQCPLCRFMRTHRPPAQLRARTDRFTSSRRRAGCTCGNPALLLTQLHFRTRVGRPSFATCACRTFRRYCVRGNSSVTFWSLLKLWLNSYQYQQALGSIDLS